MAENRIQITFLNEKGMDGKICTITDSSWKDSKNTQKNIIDVGLLIKEGSITETD